MGSLDECAGVMDTNGTTVKASTATAGASQDLSKGNLCA